jgi:hydroxyacyl-ACP dehydratase HTD2-like protein with hotdog domain
MKIRPTILNVQNAFPFRQIILSHSSLRHSSILSQAADELKSRPLNITYDYLCPTPSHLLKVSLLDFLPAASQQEYFKATSLPLVPSSHSSVEPNLLQQGHHLVYFPPPVPHRDLLPDGTDTLHSPASPTPFHRRLWAGGSLIFNTSATYRLALNGARAACIEGIRDVTIKGKEGEEKIFVHIERRIGYVNPDPEARLRHLDEDIAEEGVVKRIWEGVEAAVVERRNLVFLRGEKPLGMAEGKMERTIKRKSQVRSARDGCE